MKIFRKTKITIKIKLFRERRLLSFETPVMEFLETYLEENGHKFFLKKLDHHYLVFENFNEDYKTSEDFDIKDIILHEEEV
jgi:hypothetical protein